MKISLPLIIVLCIQCFVVGVMFEYTMRYDEIHQPKVDLPEEYKQITKSDNLKGYFDKDSILHIEFDHDNNGIKFIWNDDEESIPKDGSLIKLEQTDENTIYIGPYEELH